jgi:hypothetical protein
MISLLLQLLLPKVLALQRQVLPLALDEPPVLPLV